MAGTELVLDTGVPWGDVGLVAGLVTFALGVLWFIIKGHLMPKRTVDLLLASKDVVIASHVATIKIQASTLEAKDQQLQKLIESSTVGHEALLKIATGTHHEE